MAPEIMGKHTHFQAQVNNLCIDLNHSELEQPNKNHAVEVEIGNVKNHFWQKIVSKKVFKCFWDYGLVYKAGILNRIARGKT